MAEITFTAYVEDVVRNKGGEAFALKTSEPHYKKNGDEFVISARTFRNVKAGWDVTIDFGRFSKDDKVRITGTEITEVREYDGKKFYDLIVKATAIELDESRGERAKIPADWKPVDPNAPF